MMIYKGKKYKWNAKKFIKNVWCGLEFLLVFVTYYIIFFNMLVAIIEKYN